jgi:hypothetical protein
VCQERETSLLSDPLDTCISRFRCQNPLGRQKQVVSTHELCEESSHKISELVKARQGTLIGSIEIPFAPLRHPTSMIFCDHWTDINEREHGNQTNFNNSMHPVAKNSESNFWEPGYPMIEQYVGTV